jgi:hypothetical protein
MNHSTLLVDSLWDTSICQPERFAGRMMMIAQRFRLARCDIAVYTVPGHS